jgi:hypothetical protein
VFILVRSWGKSFVLVAPRLAPSPNRMTASVSLLGHPEFGGHDLAMVVSGDEPEADRAALLLSLLLSVTFWSDRIRDVGPSVYGRVMSWSAVTVGHVRRAIAECDELGHADFRREYGFGEALVYDLAYEGRRYDSKAILGVTYILANGERPRHYSGGAATVVPRLSRLGFTRREPPCQ